MDSNYQVVFRIHCSKCGQTLEPSSVGPEGVEHRHANANDCDQPNVTLPAITPEQFAALFTKPAKTKRARFAVPAPAKKR